MSKLAAQRAMREARYASRQAGAAATPTARPKAAAPAKAHKPVKEAAAATDDSCGHRSMNGRTCTRPAGHTEKNHRYG